MCRLHTCSAIQNFTDSQNVHMPQITKAAFVLDYMHATRSDAVFSYQEQMIRKNITWVDDLYLPLCLNHFFSFNRLHSPGEKKKGGVVCEVRDKEEEAVLNETTTAEV